MHSESKTEVRPPCSWRVLRLKETTKLMLQLNFKIQKKMETSTTWWSSTYTLNRYNTEGAPCTKPMVKPGPLSHENSPCNHSRHPHWLKIAQILHVSLYLPPWCRMGKHNTFPANTAPYCFPTLSILKQVSCQHTNTIIKVLYLLSLFYKITLSSVKLQLLKVLEWRYWLQQLYPSFKEIKCRKVQELMLITIWLL